MILADSIPQLISKAEPVVGNGYLTARGMGEVIETTLIKIRTLTKVRSPHFPCFGNDRYVTRAVFINYPDE